MLGCDLVALELEGDHVGDLDLLSRGRDLASSAAQGPCVGADKPTLAHHIGRVGHLFLHGDVAVRKRAHPFPVEGLARLDATHADPACRSQLNIRREALRIGVKVARIECPVEARDHVLWSGHGTPPRALIESLSVLLPAKRAEATW